MKYTFASAALVAGALANPMPQAVTSAIAPSSSPPSGCVTSHSGTFEITVVNVTSSSSKREVQKRDVLTLSLSNEKLTDAAGRTGYVASNYQFQFDSPPQAGAIYTSGFSLCSNNTLALGGSAIWYQCYTGGFYNLYDRHWAAQCTPVYLVAQAFSSGGGGVTQATDGQPGATSAATAFPVSEKTDGQPNGPTGVLVSQITDGQPQVPTGAPVSQISDGQPQVPTGNPVSQISDGQPQVPTGAPVSQISDGQPQVPTGAPVSQISDGQPQVPTGAPVSQISDGQPQVPTGAPVSQISDGQPQVPTGAPVSEISDGQPQVPTGAPVTQISDGQPQVPTGAPVSQISDGQPQVPLSTGVPVSQITDGQPQVPVATATGNVTVNATATQPAQFTGAAATPVYALPALAAGLFGAFAALL